MPAVPFIDGFGIAQTPGLGITRRRTTTDK